MESSSATSSRSNSTISIASSQRRASHDLRDRAEAILNNLCNSRDFDCASQYILPNVTVLHDENEPLTTREAFLNGWQKTLHFTPGFHMDIKEACVDEEQRKVWVRSEITGLPRGIVKESIDMMTFNEDGLLEKSIDCQRVKRQDGKDD